MTDDVGQVVVGAREIYDAVLVLNVKVDRLSTLNTELTHGLADHEARLRSLEKRQWPIQSATVLISFAVSVLMVVHFVMSGGL